MGDEQDKDSNESVDGEPKLDEAAEKQLALSVSAPLLDDPLAIARHENYEKHEMLSDEELQNIVPKDLHGKITSIGAILHASEKCAACSFFHFSKQGCKLGIRCKYCHAEHTKRRRPQRRAKKRKVDGDGKEAQDDAEKIGEVNAKPEASTKPLKKKGGEVPLSGINLDEFGSSRPSWMTDGERPYGRQHVGNYGSMTSAPHYGQFATASPPVHCLSLVQPGWPQQQPNMSHYPGQ